jgi:hypothetical protein
MQTARHTGHSVYHLESQLWELRQRHRVTKVHPIEMLPLEMHNTRPCGTITARDQVARLVEYED